MGMLITVDGLDGSGKSTGIEYARKTLAERGVNILHKKRIAMDIIGQNQDIGIT